MKKKRAPRRITRSYLQNWTTWYLDRWSTTEVGLRRHLVKKVHAAVEHHQQDLGEAMELVNDEIARLQRLHWLDDYQFAKDKIRSLLRRGKGPAAVRYTLQSKGVPSEVINTLLQDLAGLVELQSAARFAQKKRLGPFRHGECDRKQQQKELAKMGRAGHSFSVSRDILDAKTPADVEQMLIEAGEEEGPCEEP